MAKEKAEARRENLARLRAEQKRGERRTAFLMWGVGGLVVVVVVGLVGFRLVDERRATSLVDERRAASLDSVVSARYPGGTHVQSRVTYRESPPMGGEHNPAWQDCGVYDQPINNENAVHSMEHGAVWITYRPDLPKDEVARLKELASADYTLLSPYPGLPAKVVASSWNKQIRLEGADDPRLPKYIAKYRNNSVETPEFGASCSGGVSTTAAEAPIPADAPAPPAPSHDPAKAPAVPSPATSTPAASPSS